MNKWIESGTHHFYYYDELNGKVLGEYHRVGLSGYIHLAKVHVKGFHYTDPFILGQYVSAEYARKAVEEFLYLQDKSIDMVVPKSLDLKRNEW